MGSRAGLDGRKISFPTGFFFNLSAVIPVSIYNNYIVLVYQPTPTSKGSLTERGAMCVIFETSV